MARHILAEERIHPGVRAKVSESHADIVREVEDAVRANRVVVVGMKQNPVVKQARKALAVAGVAHAYLEYGSYFNTWRRRNALKMWTGWPTFPMIFVGGMLVGGAQELDRLIASGELARLAGDRGDEPAGAASPR